MVDIYDALEAKARKQITRKEFRDFVERIKFNDCY